MATDAHDDLRLPQGEIFVRPFDRDGRPLPDPFVIFQNPDSMRGKMIRPFSPASGDIPAGYISCGDNLVVDSGRQIIANLLGGRGYNDTTPVTDWIVSKVSFGIGDEVPRFTDITLSPQPNAGLGLSGGENEIEITTGVSKKTIFSVDWPAQQPFIVRFEIVLLPDEANGFLLREMGLWTGNDTLFARKVIAPVSKTGDIGLSWLWRIRC